MKRTSRRPTWVKAATPELAKFAATFATISLETSLLDASGHAVRRALAALGDWPEVGFQSGQALEHLAKAVIFRIDPRLLTLASKPESAAFLSGEGHAEIWFLADVYTIQGPMALERAVELLELEAPDPQEVERVFLARNAAAHLWHGDPDLAFDSVTAMLALATPLLHWMGLSLADWIEEPELTLVAEELLRPRLKSRARLRATAFSRLHNARREWQSLSTRIPVDVLAPLAASQPAPSDLDEPVLRTCLVGGHLAWFDLEWREDEVQDDVPEGEVDEEAHLSWLDCSLCGLELDGDHFWALDDEVIDRRRVDR